MAYIFYGSLFAISVLYLVIMLVIFAEHVSRNYVMLNIAIIFINLGYWLQISVQTVEAMKITNKLVYMGASLTSFLILMCISDLCKYKLPSVVKFFGVGCAVFVMGSVLLLSDTTLYYKTLEVGYESGFAYPIKEYGPLHRIYPVYLLLMMGYGIFVVVSSLRKRQKVSYITCLILLFNMTFITLMYFVERITNMKFEFLPLAYTIGFGWIILILRRVRHYDIAGLSSEAMDETNENGWIIIDNKGRFAAADKMAHEWFKEINDLEIDRLIPAFETEFMKKIEQWIGPNGDSVSQIEHFICGEKIIEAKHAVIKRDYHRRIHCIGLRDDTKQQKYTMLVEEYNDQLEKNVEAKTDKIRAIQHDITVSMASIVENRDGNTGGHIKRTSDVVKIFVKHLMDTKTFPQELTRRKSRCIINAAALHDFGKIGIPDVILNKPGKFTDEEFEEMKKHAEKGAIIVEQILKSSEDEMFRVVAINVAHYHHEKWDGHGYPEKLRETDIPFEARVMALADVFDALVSKRVYKEQFSYDQAFTIIAEGQGSQFDPKLCKLFLECRPQLEALYDSYKD